MSKKKLYIKTIDGDGFMTIEAHLREMVDLDIHERDVHPAGEEDKDYFYCRFWNECFERKPDLSWSENTLLHENPCGRHCSGYNPKNGKSGICKHKLPTYEVDYSLIRTIHINEISTAATPDNQSPQ